MNHKQVKPTVFIFLWSQHGYLFIDKHTVQPLVWDGSCSGQNNTSLLCGVSITQKYINYQLLRDIKRYIATLYFIEF